MSKASSKSLSSAKLSNSTLSQSIQNSANTIEDDIKTQQFEESFIFPLFSEISRVTSIPSIICVIQLIIQIIQSLVANLYIGNIHIWDSLTSIPKALRYLSYTINFGIIDILNEGHTEYNDNISSDNLYSCWPIYVAVIIFICIEILFIFILLFYYRKKRLFLKWSLYVANFLLSTFNSILFAPICGIFGYAVWQVDFQQTSSSIAFLVLSIIPTLIILTLTIYNNNFQCNSTYLSRSIDSCWDPRIRNLFTITIGLSSFLAPALNPFSKWFVFVGFVVILLFHGYELFLMHYLPYIREIMNSFAQAACVLSIISIVLSIAHYFTNISSNILAFVPLALFVVSAILFYVFNKFRIKSILSQFDSNNKENTEEKKDEFLKTICKGNDDTTIFYIHIGIANIVPIFYDYSIMKYIVSVKQSQRVMFALIQITAMIPAQMQFLSMIISSVTVSEHHFNITEKFILYQARKVNVIRQSVSSKEERAEAKRLNKMSNETISLVRGFWHEISHLKSDISTASLRYFRNATNRTSSSFLDAIEQYPRSQNLYDQYIRFLIEAKGDYRESIKYRKNLIMIENGKKIVHDYAFRSFANTFPMYLTEKVLNTQGMYINVNDQMQTNDGTMTSNSSQANSTYALNRSYHDDEISSTIFDHSKLRLALQDVINSSTMNSLNFLRAFSIFTFLLIILIIIILLLVSSKSSISVHSLVKSISLLSKILTNIQYSGLTIGARLTEYYAQELKYGELYPDISNDFCYYSTIICEQLNISNSSMPQEPSVYKDPLVKINMLVKDIRTYMQEELDIIFSDPSLHMGEIILMNEWSMNSSHFAYYDTSKLNFQAQISLVSSLQGIINMVTRQIEYVSSTNASKYFDINDWAFIDNYDIYTLVIINYIIIGKGFDSLFLNISETGIDNCDNYGNTYDVLIYIISIVAIIIFFILRLINFLYMKKDFKNLSHLLQGFNKDDISASSMPIYLNNKEPLPTGTVHSAHDFSIEVFMIPFLFALITADCVFVEAYICMQTHNFFDTFAHVFEWSNGAAQRASLLMQLIISLHFDNSGLREDFDLIDYANLTESLKNISAYQTLIDMEIIGKDSRFDDFYYFDHCGFLNESYDFAEISDCLSVSNKINSALNQLTNMNREFEEYAGILFTYDYAALMYNLDKSIYSEFISFMDYLNTFSMKISDENNSHIQTISIVGIVILVILFIIENIFINMLYNSLEGFKQLIYTLSPISACRNRYLLLFLSNKKMNYDSMSTVDLVLHNSQFSIVTINENFIIQTINQEFCKLTDYSSQKLLGQSITYLIPLPTDGNGKIAFEKSPFYAAINDMRSNPNSKESSSVKIKMRKEDLSFIHMNANLIKITDSSQIFKGVTLLLKSSEENVEMKNKLEQEKMNVNNLIKVLIPRGALSSVKGKKNSAFFKADEATMIFVEVAGMSDCISMMSPKGILDILQQIYNGIEMALKKFKSISMLRWENEMIFAVSGLFENVGDFKKQAFETLAFMIEILQNLEDTNIQANTDFHLRLGAHTGGPVMGFVKDPNNPCFNILSGSFKYLNFIKENCPIDRPWVTASFVKHLDTNIVDMQKEATFVSDQIEEDIYAVQFKEGYKIPDNEEDAEENNDDNNIVKIEEEEEDMNGE